MSDPRQDLIVQFARMREILPRIITSNNAIEFSELVRKVEPYIRESNELIQVLKRHRMV